MSDRTVAATIDCDRCGGSGLEYDLDARKDWVVAGPCLGCEVDALRLVVRLLVDRFHDETPMGPNVIDLPNVRWRILPPHVAKAVKRALDSGRVDAP